jgi:hypothetical protein
LARRGAPQPDQLRMEQIQEIQAPMPWTASLRRSSLESMMVPMDRWDLMGPMLQMPPRFLKLLRRFQSHRRRIPAVLRLPEPLTRDPPQQVRTEILLLQRRMMVWMETTVRMPPPQLPLPH